MDPHVDRTAPGVPARIGLALFFLGFLTLFLELVLIRYLAGNIWNLGFFPNLVLLCAFLGIGSGFACHPFLSERASLVGFRLAPVLLLLLVVFVRVLNPGVPGFAGGEGQVGGELFYSSTPADTSTHYALFALWVVMVVVTFASIGQYTAKLFRRLAPLRAYSFDIGGSCCGIVAFMALSWTQAPAGIWFLLCAPPFILALPRLRVRDGVIAAAALALCTAVAFDQDSRLLQPRDIPTDMRVLWSPYQKIEFVKQSKSIFVNGIGHQSLRPRRHLARTMYEAPHIYRKQEVDRPPYERVLVIGAGGGNDVAVALAHGATHVDAVEIDPAIARLGLEFHPDAPYLDPRVRLTVGDGRAFLTNAREPYDLIVFALTDSLVKVSPVAQLRLENYLFTQESFRRAFELLTPDGSLVLYNYYRREWVIEKIEHAVRAATGVEPERRVHGDGNSALVIADRAGPPAQPSSGEDGALEAATDDWPFPYLQKRGVPRFYLGLMGGLVVYVLALFVWAQGRLRRRPPEPGANTSATLKVAFAAMGAGFLLLETKSVIQFSLLFGTTWLNNSLVFLGVLVLVLAANWMAYLLRSQSRTLLRITFPALILSCLVSLAYPLGNLLQIDSLVLRFISATLLTFSPIFFANLLFSTAFRDQPAAELLFAWNLLGATLGGVFEYASMMLGYNALGAIVALLYALAFALLLPSVRSAVPAQEAVVRG
jgi:spermidine synthase